MELFLKTLSLQFVMMCYIVCGFIGYKLKIIGEQGRGTLISVVLDLMMPIMIFRSFTLISTATLQRAIPMLLMAVLICLYSLAIAKLVFRKASEDKRAVLNYDSLINNISFAGIPLVQTLYDSTGVIYSSVYTLVTRIAMWTVGLSFFTGKQASAGETLKKLALNPNIIATGVGIIWCLFALPVPGFLDSAFAGVSACVAPISMMIVGTVIATVELRELWDEYMLRYCLVRLIVIPLLAFAFCRVLGFDDVQTGSVLILSAMPAPSTSAILAGKYGGNLHYASKLLFVSNILSIITVPAMMLLI